MPTPLVGRRRGDGRRRGVVEPLVNLARRRAEAGARRVHWREELRRRAATGGRRWPHVISVPIAASSVSASSPLRRIGGGRRRRRPSPPTASRVRAVAHHAGGRTRLCASSDGDAAPRPDLRRTRAGVRRGRHHSPPPPAPPPRQRPSPSRRSAASRSAASPWARSVRQARWRRRRGRTAIVSGRARRRRRWPICMSPRRRPAGGSPSGEELRPSRPPAARAAAQEGVPRTCGRPPAPRTRRTRSPSLAHVATRLSSGTRCGSGVGAMCSVLHRAQHRRLVEGRALDARRSRRRRLGRPSATRVAADGASGHTRARRPAVGRAPGPAACARRHAMAARRDATADRARERVSQTKCRGQPTPRTTRAGTRLHERRERVQTRVHAPPVAAPRSATEGVFEVAPSPLVCSGRSPLSPSRRLRATPSRRLPRLRDARSRRASATVWSPSPRDPPRRRR